jgi:hypothetical protein
VWQQRPQRVHPLHLPQVVPGRGAQM